VTRYLVVLLVEEYSRVRALRVPDAVEVVVEAAQRQQVGVRVAHRAQPVRDQHARAPRLRRVQRLLHHLTGTVISVCRGVQSRVRSYGFIIYTTTSGNKIITKFYNSSE
jgi:hypothetical protein